METTIIRGNSNVNTLFVNKMEPPSMDPLVYQFLRQFGIYLQALFIQTYHSNLADWRIRLDLEGLEYYAFCMFGSHFSYHLITGDIWRDLEHDQEVTLENYKTLIKPEAIYSFHLETGWEQHYFTLLYPAHSMPLVFSTDGTAPVFSIIPWKDPHEMLLGILQLNIPTLREAFGTMWPMDVEGTAKLHMRRSSFRWPMVSDLHSILEDISEIVETEAFQNDLKREEKIWVDMGKPAYASLITMKDIRTTLTKMKEGLTNKPCPRA